MTIAAVAVVAAFILDLTVGTLIIAGLVRLHKNRKEKKNVQ